MAILGSANLATIHRITSQALIFTPQLMKITSQKFMYSQYIVAVGQRNILSTKCMY